MEFSVKWGEMSGELLQGEKGSAPPSGKPITFPLHVPPVLLGLLRSKYRAGNFGIIADGAHSD